MSKKSYNWFANTGMLLGIISAWLYQHSEVPHIVAIVFAAAAAILSVGTYFYDRFFPQNAKEAEVPIALDVLITTDSGADILTEAKSAPRVTLLQNREQEIILAEFRAETQRTLVDRIRELASIMEAQREAEMERTAAYMQHYLQHNNAGRRLRYRFPTDDRLMEPEVELSEREAAACYKQIMRDIVNADDDTEWDFTVDAKGLRVSGKKQHLKPLPTFQMDEMNQRAGEADVPEHFVRE